MDKNDSNLSRRKFMAAGSAAIAVPFVMNMAGKVPETNAAEKKVEKQYNFVDTKSCDLVVIGGGGSGLVGAVRVAQLTGKKVIVLEKDSTAGGGAQGARTMRTFGSKWQAKRNLPDTTEEYCRAMMDYVFWKLDPKLVINCLLGTGQFFDWVCELRGDIEDKFTAGKYKLSDLESEPIGPQVEEQIDGKNFGGLITSIMIEKCKSYGVEVLTKHPVVDVEVNEGKIVAAITKCEKGYVRVTCKACILATGSWIRNEEILKKYTPQFAAVKQYIVGAPTAQSGIFGNGNSNVGHWSTNYTGDGVALAEKAGAFVDYDSFCLRLMGPIWDYARDHGTSRVFLAMGQSPYIITVNLDGKRYSSEPVGHIGHFSDGHVQVDQPRGQSHDIFDENTLAAEFARPKCSNNTEDADTLACYGMTYMKPSEEIRLPKEMKDVRSSIKEGFDKGDPFMFRADTLEDLADRIGVNKKNFIETVRRYNESCEKGVDFDFFKRNDALVPISKPPYYAFLGKLMTDGAFGGVQVNPDMQAYRPDKGLVEGLYVTGDFASGRFINLGGVKHQVLNDISWAFSSGFLAGTNAGRYLENLG